MSFLRFLYQTYCAFLQIKDRKHIELNFHSVAGVMPQGWDLGVLGGSKTLAWGFAMASHRLRILVLHVLLYLQIVLAYMICKRDNFMFSPTWLTNQQYS